MVKLTPKQIIAIKSIASLDNKIYYLFDGSARCGKTYAILRFIILNSLKHSGIRTLIARYRFNHARASVWEQTLLPLLRQMFSSNAYEINKTDYVIRFAWGSEIWLGGLDDGDRLEKILGTEWACIFVNEATQITYDTFNTLKTRLNCPGVPLKFLLDCNPRNPGHWLHRQFITGINPQTGQKLADDVIAKQYRLNWHVFDNKDNLSPEYISILESMSGVKKKRLFDGIWCDSSEGTIYRFNREVNISGKELPYYSQFRTYCCWDFGVMDDTAIIWFQVASVPKSDKNKKGLIINIIDEYCNNNQEADHYADIVMAKPYSDVTHYGDPAGTARGQNLESWIGKLNVLSHGKINIKYTSSYSPIEQIDNANDYMPYVKINETACPRVTEMFENWSYIKDKDDKVPEGAKPEHNEYSHFGTAWYYGLINLFPPRGPVFITTK